MLIRDAVSCVRDACRVFVTLQNRAVDSGPYMLIRDAVSCVRDAVLRVRDFAILTDGVEVIFSIEEDWQISFTKILIMPDSNFSEVSSIHNCDSTAPPI